MTFNQEPPNRDGHTGRGPVDPANQARLAQIDTRLGHLADKLTDGERRIRQIFAQRCDITDEIRRLYRERNTIVSVDTSQKWTREVRAHREAAAEVALALGMSERPARNFVERAQAIVHELPATRTALARGDISFRHAEIITQEASSLPPEGRPIFEAAAVPEAMTKTAARFKKRARILRERVHPIPLQERHDTAMEDRTVYWDPEPDGMATLTYTDNAATVLAIYNRIDGTARALQGPNESRTLPQLRADTLGDLGLNGTPSNDYNKGVTPTVLIAVPVLTAIGTGTEPAMMDGYGPIDPETARRLAATAPSFHRILTHPDTGAILSLGRSTYTVPKDLRRWLQLRDGTCRAATGCPTTTDKCDMDHTIDWQYGGDTDAENLAFLCQSHHNFKQFTAFTYRHLGGGRLEWTSPSGRTYITEPDSFVGPMPFTLPDTPGDPALEPPKTPDGPAAGHRVYEAGSPAEADSPAEDDPIDEWAIPNDPLYNQLHGTRLTDVLGPPTPSFDPTAPPDDGPPDEDPPDYGPPDEEPPAQDSPDEDPPADHTPPDEDLHRE
ncbi:HNH endonuclease signature motif containing protein [Glaciihabitans sp. dw_435]|uniref:HNH endonuclease signature motif containing protein n=1 Tax=Glaciihabitans sp. dw_435 TaxID=2720081 RepID=UPI001BD57CD5|nr:HNH endonuclease signature motif containing protein [Glaciihabitans sp. dw_435]